MTLKNIFVFAVLIGLLLPRASSAQVFVYTNETAYDNASSSIVSAITFDGLATPTTATDYGVGGSLSVGGINFTASNSTDLSVYGQNYAGPYDSVFLPNNTVTSPYLIIGYGNNGNSIALTATLPTTPVGVSAIGGDFGASNSVGPMEAIILLANGTEATYQMSPPPSVVPFQFFGFISSNSPIISIQFDEKEVTPEDFDNITYGVANTGSPTGGTVIPSVATPEPGATMLLILGVGASVLCLRRSSTLTL
jgi:hypothetical protein